MDKVMKRGRLLRRSGVAVALVAEAIEWIPDWVYQVGVGVHCYETEVFQVAWPDAKYLGWEPHPSSYEVQKDNYPGELRNLALANYQGTAKLYLKPRHRDGSSLFPVEDAGTFDVRVDTFDSQVPQPVARSLLWVDCEGSELLVLEGATNALRVVDAVNVEMTAKPYQEEWGEVKQIHNLLAANGYRRQWIHTQRISQGQVDVIYVKDRLFRPEYCCCPCQLGGCDVGGSV